MRRFCIFKHICVLLSVPVWTVLCCSILLWISQTMSANHYCPNCLLCAAVFLRCDFHYNMQIGLANKRGSVMYKLQEWVLGRVLFGSHHVPLGRHDTQSRQEEGLCDRIHTRTHTHTRGKKHLLEILTDYRNICTDGPSCHRQYSPSRCFCFFPPVDRRKGFPSSCLLSNP